MNMEDLVRMMKELIRSVRNHLMLIRNCNERTLNGVFDLDTMKE